MLRKLFCLVVVLILVSGLVVGCGNGNGEVDENGELGIEPQTLRMSVTTAEDSSWTQGAYRFAELVEERTDGLITVNVTPNEQLSGGDQARGVQMVMDGSTHLSYHSNIIYSVMDERLSVISLPWLLPNEEVADEKLAGEAGDAIKEIMEENNVVVLAFGENGFRQITNNVRPIKTPADMEDLRIRVPGMAMYISLYRELGADPQAMDFAEVFTSLQQGAIDGQENPLDVIYSSNLYEVQEHISLWNYSYDALLLGINKDTFESFDEETQNIIEQAAIEASEYQRMLNREMGEDQLVFFEEQGMEITRLSEDDMSAFQEVMAPIYDEYEDIIGADLIELFR